LCGRFNLFTSIDIITEELNVERVLFEPPSRYNISPTQTISAVYDDRGMVEDGLRWGLIPPWSKEGSGSSPLINARSESLFEKPTFKVAILSKRCVIPADGFFEWAHTKAGRLPYYIRRPDGRPFYMGGIFEDWRSPGGENVRSCAIITTSAYDPISKIHDRMPIIYDKDMAVLYLDPDLSDRPSIETILDRNTTSGLDMYRVGTEVNSASVEGMGLIAPVQEWF
jgi:putative SOS response-associated peptidase YedK